MLTGARRFDRRIQSQQIGLVGNIVDDADLLGDLLHRANGILHGHAALGRFASGLGGHAVRDFRVVGVLSD